MKIAFFGTGEFSQNILAQILENNNVEVKLIVSQPDKHVGRKKKLEKTHVKILGESHNIEVLQPEKLIRNFPFLDYLDSCELDFILVVAYGKIVPKRVLNAAKYGCINLHGSILPAYRGASPIQEAIKNGDMMTGLTIMHMSKGMDEGDVLKIEKIPIGKNDTSVDIFHKMENIGGKLALKTLEQLLSGGCHGITQEHAKATYCSKIMKEDGRISFSTESSQGIYNRYRAYYSWPGIYTFYKDVKLNIETCEIFDEKQFPSINIADMKIENYQAGSIIKIDKKNIGIVCADSGILVLRQVKLSGKKSMDILSFLNGNAEVLDYIF